MRQPRVHDVRWWVAIAVIVIGALAIFAAAFLGRPSISGCAAGQPCATQLLTLPTRSSEPSPTSPFTFADEFDGTSLSSSWDRHYDCCGAPIAGYDPSLVSVSDGLLHLRAERRSGGWWVYLIDTKDSFTQLYGKFEARIKIPVGRGFWPAFWAYLRGDNELDVMEVCANPPGTFNGVDTTLLHTSIHVEGVPDAARETRVADLSNDFHIYGAEWRESGVTFYLDGAQVFRWDDRAHAFDAPLAVILDLGAGGGDFCGPTTGETPSSGEMLVDWIHVSP